MWDFFGSAMSSIASMYGYKKITPLIANNIGLAAVLTAMVVLSFVMWQLFKKGFPTQGKDPARTMVVRLALKFLIGMFAIVFLFAIFAESKKTIKEIKNSGLDYGISVYSTDYA
jgi:hypothetical protein